MKTGETVAFSLKEIIHSQLDRFIESQDRRSKPFIEQLMHFQHFQQFVSERLAVLNEGQGITDLFEKAPRNSNIYLANMVWDLCVHFYSF